MEVELLKLLPGGGSVVALIIVVILFLKQQEKTNNSLSEIADKFNQQVTANQKAYQDQLTELTKNQNDNLRHFQTQIQGVIDNHMNLTRETISQIKSLESAMKEIQKRNNT